MQAACPATGWQAQRKSVQVAHEEAWADLGCCQTLIDGRCHGRGGDGGRDADRGVQHINKGAMSAIVPILLGPEENPLPPTYGN